MAMVPKRRPPFVVVSSHRPRSKRALHLSLVPAAPGPDDPVLREAQRQYEQVFDGQTVMKSR